MNKLEKKFNQQDYAPKRFGLKYNPPQIVIEYLTPSTGKLYHHKIKLNKFKGEPNLQELIKEIYEKHYMYLDNKKINPTQIVRLVEKLSNVKGKSSNDENSSANKPNSKNSIQNLKEGASPNNKQVDINELDDEDEDYYKFFDYENEDLNKLDNDELRKRKDEMEKLYNKNAVLPGDNNFVFDVRKDFEHNKFDAEWDEEEEEDEYF